MNLRRRAVLQGLSGLGAAFALPPGLALAQDGETFSFDTLKALARDLAARPHVPRPEAAGDLDALTYDEGFRVVFDPRRTVTMGGDWGLQFFPLGTLTRRAVEINLVEGGVSRRLAYDPSWFIVPEDSPFNALPDDIGFAGFRAVAGPGRAEWLSFLGASYFRSPAPFAQYGLSARGLALDTYAKQPEEFPDFTRFWLGPDADGRLVVHALMESPGVVGAYRFAHGWSGEALVQDVEAMLVFRRGFEQPGIAPLTSMFWYGENSSGPREDWRPEIHDSDGLAIWTGADERIWRPLSNPPRVVTSTFADENPRGFGLIQRDRDHDNYQDSQAYYDRRPSLWVEPVGNWGRGSVRLVEAPTRTETLDNIVAFWTPAVRPEAGQMRTLRYRLTWDGDAPGLRDLGRVVATRAGRAGPPGAPPGAGRRVAVEFRGAGLVGLEPAQARAVVTASRGAVSNIELAVGDPAETGFERMWRLIFDVAPTSDEPADVRAFIRTRNGRRLTEVWTAQIFADRAT